MSPLEGFYKKERAFLKEILEKTAQVEGAGMPSHSL